MSYALQDDCALLIPTSNKPVMDPNPFLGFAGNDPNVPEIQRTFVPDDNQAWPTGRDPFTNQIYEACCACGSSNGSGYPRPANDPLGASGAHYCTASAVSSHGMPTPSASPHPPCPPLSSFKCWVAKSAHTGNCVGAF